MRPTAAPLDARGHDQPRTLEPVEPVVDDRPADRPDRPDLAAARELRSQRPPVRATLGHQREHGPVVVRELVDHRQRSL